MRLHPTALRRQVTEAQSNLSLVTIIEHSSGKNGYILKVPERHCFLRVGRDSRREVMPCRRLKLDSGAYYLFQFRIA